jgi:NAD dependent epimerase/dehydratase
MANYWKNRNVLVTGAGGFIGSHLCDALVQQGANVSALLKYSSSGHIGSLQFSSHRASMKLHFGNIEDQEQISNLTKNNDTVFHLAALIGIPYSYHAVESYLKTNVIGTYNVLNACQRANVRKVVITSTSECYGTAQYAPIDEKHPLQAQSPYAASKISADKLAESMFLSFKLPVTIARPFNTYGPRQSARAVIPTILSQAIMNKKVKLGSLSPKRDFNFVSDTVDGFLKIAESDKSNGELYNFGSGVEVSIGEVCELAKEILGFDFSIESQEERIRPEASEVFRLLADSSKAKNDLSWSSKVNLREGLRQTADFVKANLAQFNTKGYTV